MTDKTQLDETMVQGADRHVPTANLPVQLTSFVGREDAMAQVGRLFSAARLVTLTGPGGCGKTRLALQVVPALAKQLDCDLVWVELDSVTDPVLVPQTISRAVSAVDAPDVDVLNSIVSNLRASSRLLIIDNCEQVIAILAQIAEQLLMRCPRLYLLVTSREALNIPGETAWNVPPLRLPEDETGDRTSESVRLFVDRARSADPSFNLTPGNIEDVARICQRIDGMPLGIELAASRLRLLGVHEVADRLDQSFSLLTAGRRTALPRHQTLHATIDWSYELLTPDERMLFARLSIFSGSFTLGAVEDVCVDDSLQQPDMLDLLANLVDKSLVIADRYPGGSRYRLLQTIREYAREKLSGQGGEVTFRSRHARWCVQLAESGYDLEAAGQAEIVERFEQEHDNFRAAMQWSFESGDAERLGRIASALWRFWLMRGYLREGESWLLKASGRLPDESPLRPSVLHGAAVLTSYQAEYKRSTKLFNEALMLYRRHGDLDGQGASLHGLATSAQYQGEYDVAAKHFEEALLLFNHPRGRAISRMGLALTLAYLGDFGRAESLCTDSLELCRSIKDDRSLAGALTTLGIIRFARGEMNLAEEVCRESLELRRRVGDRGGIAHTLTVMGWIALEQINALLAARRFREALSLRYETSEIGDIAGPLEGVAAVDISNGATERGTQEMATAESIRNSHGTSLTPIERNFRDRYLSIARSNLDASRFQSYWDAGLSSEPDEILRSALAPVEVRTGTEPNVDSERGSFPSDPSDELEKVPELQVFTLGRSRVLLRGGEIPGRDWTYAKSRELFFYLLERGPSAKEQIGLALWPEASESQLRSAFHTTLHHLRRALGNRAWIFYRNGTYRFNRSRSFSYDAGSFEQEISRARRLATNDRRAAIELFDRAVARYQGKYLADLVGVDWHLNKQTTIEREYLESLLLLGDLLVIENQFTRAADVYRRAIAADQFLESAHRELMRCFELQGERGQALRHYQTLAMMLDEELGAEPDEQTRELYERLRHGSG